MKRKIILLSCLAALIMAGSAFGAIVFDTPEEKPKASPHLVENDPRLPAYNNPVEVDLDGGQLHVSFKGVFRVDKDHIAFMFIAIPHEDMTLKISESAVFDGNGHKFDDYDWHNYRQWIGGARTREREIIAGVPTIVHWYAWVDEGIAGSLPTIARASFSFNNQEIQYRNVKSHELSAWEKLRQELGL